MPGVSLSEYIIESGDAMWQRIRIEKIKISNIRNVHFGEISFACARSKNEVEPGMDILGLYGQNGSGKTVFIDVLRLLKSLLTGGSLSDEFPFFISDGKEEASVEYSFLCEFVNGDVYHYVYYVEFAQEEKSHFNDIELFDLEFEKKPVIVREVLSISGNIDGKKIRFQPIIDTATENIPFGPAVKYKKWFVKNEQSARIIDLNMGVAEKENRSRIFTKRVFDIVCNAFGDEYVQLTDMIQSLKDFAVNNFFVLSTDLTNNIRKNTTINIYTQRGFVELDVKNPTHMPEDFFNELSSTIDNINLALEQLISGYKIGLKPVGRRMTKKGVEVLDVELISCKRGLEIPLRFESDGIRKMISCLQLIISAYNNPGITVAIDELDAGVFEYLLGELLIIMEETGQGQFIFTSHNLRPLEVINKKFLYFTTINPENRYIKLKYVRDKNNLRDTYFREIIFGGQDEELYNNTKRYRLAAALRKAGGCFEK